MGLAARTKGDLRVVRLFGEDAERVATEQFEARLERILERQRTSSRVGLHRL